MTRGRDLRYGMNSARSQQGVVPAEWVGAIAPLGSWVSSGSPPSVVAGFLPSFCLAQVLSAVLTGGQPRETDYSDRGPLGPAD
jgi:hypothetical protein